MIALNFPCICSLTRSKLIRKFFQVLLNDKEISQPELDFLLRFPYSPNETSPVDFLTNVLWGGILSLVKMEVFE